MAEYEVRPVALYSLTSFQVNELSFEEGSPFDDNGGDTDGPSYLLEVAKINEGDYGLKAPEGFFFGPEVEGYRLDGYTDLMRDSFIETKAGRWMGNLAQQFALFITSEEKLEKLEKIWDELPD